MLYFTHLRRSPQWMDFYQIWYRRSPRGRNQLCLIFCRSVQGHWFCGGCGDFVSDCDTASYMERHYKFIWIYRMMQFPLMTYTQNSRSRHYLTLSRPISETTKNQLSKFIQRAQTPSQNACSRIRRRDHAEKVLVIHACWRCGGNSVSWEWVI